MTYASQSSFLRIAYLLYSSIPIFIFIIVVLWILVKIIVGTLKWLVRKITGLFGKQVVIPTYRIYSKEYVKKLETYLNLTRNELLVFDISEKTPAMAIFTIAHMMKTMSEIDKRLAKQDTFDFLYMSSLVQDWKSTLSHIHTKTKGK